MRYRLVVLILLCLIAGPLTVNGQEADSWNELFSHETFVSPSHGTLKYRLLVPEKLAEGKKYPLVLFLHGAGERGDDNDAQLVHGMREFSSDQHRKSWPAFVIAPQCPTGHRWVDVDWGAKQLAAPEKAGDELQMCRELIDEMSSQKPIDVDRIYVVGLSMGGYGTFDAAMRWPELFAAATAICGGADTSSDAMERMKKVPFWIAHGADDNVVPVEQSRRVVEALTKAGAEPRFVEMEGVGHNSWQATFADEAFFEWLFSQKRSDR